ncbi:MAG: hypothetical protein JST83_13840 [Bacteroidetes bacterium]|nr:hypothetical protein [Bacteroidota bacterium]
MDYEFESIGKKGIIKKVARFTKIGEDQYSFGFGDLDEMTGNIDDKIASRNGDGDKVLKTVARIIYDFTAIYNKAWIYIEGSTASRTRVYQMGITKYWDEISLHFDIWGIIGDTIEPFEKGKNYEKILGRRKDAFSF